MNLSNFFEQKQFYAFSYLSKIVTLFLLTSLEICPYLIVTIASEKWVLK